MMNVKRLAIIALFSILATACSTQKQISTPEAGKPSPKVLQKSIDSILARAATAPAAEAGLLKIEAAELMLSQNKKTEAQTLIQSIQVELLPIGGKHKLTIIQATIDLAFDAAANAQTKLTALDDTTVDNNHILKQKYTLLAQAAQALQQPLAQALALINASQYTTVNEEIVQLNETIWPLLAQSQPQQLINLSGQPDNDYTLRGWLDLIITVQNNADDAKLAANQWIVKWASHRVATHPTLLLSKYLSKEPIVNTPYSISHVAIALPKSGNYAKAAKAITDGMLLASTLDPENTIQISYIDTAVDTSAAAILSRASTLGVDAVIGPLNKSLVAEISQQDALPLPVLALNYSVLSNSNLYQFGLSTEDEARDAAVRAFQDGRRNMLVLTSNDNKGQKAATAFANKFNALGGNVASINRYDMQAGNLTTTIAKMLGINQGRVRYLQKKLKTGYLRSAIRNMRRKDVDGIFLMASAADAYQIGPSILYFYADDLPLYATSKIYGSKHNPTLDIDLNGMMFGDLPWVLAPESALKQKLTLTHPNTNTRFGRLYALGIDAFSLVPHLYDLAEQTKVNQTGETGVLSVSENNRVIRGQSWAKFVDGIPELIITE